MCLSPPNQYYMEPDTPSAMLTRKDVAGQAQLACHVTWLDPIADGEMVQQSVANCTKARVQANILDQM